MVAENDISLEEKVKQILLHHHGRRNAISGLAIAHRLGARDDRGVRLIIRRLIADGFPIASSVSPPLGYFIVETMAEAVEYQDSLLERLKKDAVRRRDFKKAAGLWLGRVGQGRLI